MTKYKSKWHVKQIILELFPEVTLNIQVIIFFFFGCFWWIYEPFTNRKCRNSFINTTMVQRLFFQKKLILLLNKDVKLTVNTFIMLPNCFISNKYF